MALIWLPFAAQAAVAVTVAYGIMAGDTDLGDGILACSISAILAGLLGYVWITEQRSLARDGILYSEGDSDIPVGDEDT